MPSLVDMYHFQVINRRQINIFKVFRLLIKTWGNVWYFNMTTLHTLLISATIKGQFRFPF